MSGEMICDCNDNMLQQLGVQTEEDKLNFINFNCKNCGAFVHLHALMPIEADKQGGYCAPCDYQKVEWKRENNMEKLSHAHPPPNCPSCEEVGRLRAEDINRRKLEAAEELAILVKALCRAVRMAPTDRLKAGIDEDLAIRTQYFITEIDAVSAALSAWEKAGK